MEIGFCPFFDGRNPKNFAFAADIKIPPSRRKDRSDAEEKVSKLFAAFMNEVSRRILGESYVEMTGASLSYQYKLKKINENSRWYIDAKLIYPNNVSQSEISLVATSAWQDSKLSDSKFFIGNVDENVSAQYAIEADHYRRGWWQRTFGGQ